MLAADHEVDMTVSKSCHDHLLAEVDDRSEDQGIGIVDPDILTDDNQLVHYRWP